MGRHKTISDADVLRVARDVFRADGHTATTRMIARAAGISEAVLYQRFGSKDELFFAAMRPTGPDVDGLLGPPDPPADARAYLRQVTVRLGQYFADVIPLALHLMTHPAFDPAVFARAQPTASTILKEGLAGRLRSLADRKRLAATAPDVVARLLVSLAHDWALGGILSPRAAAARLRELTDLVDVVWTGLRPAKN
jgi:AcrR family transcriptional regulator